MTLITQSNFSQTRGTNSLFTTSHLNFKTIVTLIAITPSKFLYRHGSFLMMPRSCWNTKSKEVSLKRSTPSRSMNAYESALMHTVVDLLTVGCLAVAVAHPRPSSRRKTYRRVLTSMSYSNMLKRHWAVETSDRL